ncbi:MAG: ribbon-helix-helix domain-containing protein [Candidatus Nanohaloarchaea archaeon]|nr:ribbon-helix-helix domain-containing protein [Candidatus Nanohaloarchaea archaeon]
MATSVDLPEGLEQAIEAELARGTYTSKSELIRDAIRHLLRDRDRVEDRQLAEDVAASLEEAQDDATIPHGTVRDGDG